MMRDSEITPCYGCQIRHAECHSYCEQYSAWNAAHIKARDEAYAARLAERAVDDVIMTQGKRTRADSIRKYGERKKHGTVKG